MWKEWKEKEIKKLIKLREKKNNYINEREKEGKR